MKLPVDRIVIRRLAREDLEPCLAGLAELTYHAVAAGAAIGFVYPFTVADSRMFWQEAVYPKVASGDIVLLAALLDGRPIGTVQLHLAMPANQPHRCEVAKLIVHPGFRRQGIATHLMRAVEAEAVAAGKLLILLDTRTGDRAEPLYASLGYETVGTVPDFAIDPDKSAFHATTYMYRALHRAGFASDHEAPEK